MDKFQYLIAEQLMFIVLEKIKFVLELKSLCKNSKTKLKKKKKENHVEMQGANKWL